MSAPYTPLTAFFVAGTAHSCWPWTGTIERHGYGRYGKHRLAHRAVYEHLVGPIPPGLTLDHTCHTRACQGRDAECPHRRCVNPSHLQPVTRAVNIQRGNAPSIRNYNNPTCRNGHPRTPENVGRQVSGRTCRVCNREAVRRYVQRKKARIASPEEVRA